MSNFLGPNGHILYFPILVCACQVLFKNIKDGGCARGDRGDTVSLSPDTTWQTLETRGIRADRADIADKGNRTVLEVLKRTWIRLLKV